MKQASSVLYQETLSSPLYIKVSQLVLVLIGGYAIFTIGSLLLSEANRWMFLFVMIVVILYLLHVGVSVKKAFISGEIIVTSEGLRLIHGRQIVSFSNEDITYYEHKHSYSRSKNGLLHVLRKEGDIMSGYILCQIFPDTFLYHKNLFLREGVFLVTKRTTPSWGGLFGKRILVDLPFFIPTRHPDRLRSALGKISPVGLIAP